MKVNCSISFILPVLYCFALILQPSSSMLEWLFGDGNDGQSTNDDASEIDSAVRFEVLSADEKFLDFARTLNDLSPLDACYNIVIYNLKKKCGELTEEELGKLSVQLLNCQSEVEDRPVFKCTSSMTLADCTKTMDGNTWNSYQIVGNRARAMCYATQQLQFRKLTEVTVNRLAAAANDQINSLNDLKVGQEQLHSLTSETVRKLYESQQDLLSTQHALRAAHDDIFQHIATNVKEIMQEKALIASGNRELAAMTEHIKDKLDSTAQQIQEREAVEHKKHERILQDLRDIQDNTESSVHKLEANLKKLLTKYEELDSQYTDMSAGLIKMNTTIVHVMGAVERLGKTLEKRIAWISQLLGGADNKLSAMSCCLLHIAYFFLLAVTATFLQVSLPVRLTMLVIIVGNVAAELNYNHSLDFAGLTVFLCTMYFSFKLIMYTGRKFKVADSRYNPLRQCGITYMQTSTAEALSAHEMRTLLDLMKRFADSVSEAQSPRHSPVANGTVVHDTSFRPATPPPAAGLNRSRDSPARDLGETLFGGSPAFARTLASRLRGQQSGRSSRSSTPLPNDSRASTPSVSSRCLANTVTGAQCRLPAVGGSDFCRRHEER